MEFQSLTEVKLCNEHIQRLPEGGWPEYQIRISEYTRVMPVGRTDCAACLRLPKGEAPKRYREKGRDVPVVTRQQERAVERKEAKGKLYMAVEVTVYDSVNVVHRRVRRVFERERDVTVEKFDEIERVLTKYISEGNGHG